MSGEVGRQAKRQMLAQQILVACFLAGGVTGAASYLLSDLEIALPRGLLFVASLMVIAAMFVASIVYWRNIDEAAREAHKFAWFWGGAGGLLVILPMAALATSDRLVAVFGQREPSEWAIFGVVSLLTVQLAGYGLVWAGWWLRQR